MKIVVTSLLFSLLSASVPCAMEESDETPEEIAGPLLAGNTESVFRCHSYYKGIISDNQTLLKNLDKVLFDIFDKENIIKSKNIIKSDAYVAARNIKKQANKISLEALKVLERNKNIQDQLGQKENELLRKIDYEKYEELRKDIILNTYKFLENFNDLIDNDVIKNLIINPIADSIEINISVFVDNIKKYADELFERLSRILKENRALEIQLGQAETKVPDSNNQLKYERETTQTITDNLDEKRKIPMDQQMDQQKLKIPLPKDHIEDELNACKITHHEKILPIQSQSQYQSILELVSGFYESDVRTDTTVTRDPYFHCHHFLYPSSCLKDIKYFAKETHSSKNSGDPSE